MIRHPLPTPAFEIPEEDIGQCAYFLWLEAGRRAGRDREFWHPGRERPGHSPHCHRPPASRRPGKRCANLAKKRGAAPAATG